MDLAGVNLTVEMTSEHSVAMATGRSTYHFGFRLTPATEMPSLTYAEFQELNQFMAFLIAKNLSKHVQLK
jgi:hypothetical protein